MNGVKGVMGYREENWSLVFLGVLCHSSRVKTGGGEESTLLHPDPGRSPPPEGRPVRTRYTVVGTTHYRCTLGEVRLETSSSDDRKRHPFGPLSRFPCVDHPLLFLRSGLGGLRVSGTRLEVR